MIGRKRRDCSHPLCSPCTHQHSIYIKYYKLNGGTENPLSFSHNKHNKYAIKENQSLQPARLAQKHTLSNLIDTFLCCCLRLRNGSMRARGRRPLVAHFAIVKEALGILFVLVIFGISQAQKVPLLFLHSSLRTRFVLGELCSHVTLSMRLYYAMWKCSRF